MTQQLYDGEPDGVQIGGAATDKVAFYGATPVVQQTVAAYSTTTAATSTSPWGFSTSTQANAINARMIEITAALRNLGLGA
jgi:hypothetical protein